MLLTNFSGLHTQQPPAAQPPSLPPSPVTAPSSGMEHIKQDSDSAL